METAVPRRMIGTRFQTLIVQPATLCNLDCKYCYLPSRRRQRLMSQAVVQRLAASVEEQNAPYPVEVVWHGGEPLTTPLQHMYTLLEPFESLRQTGRVLHSVQTNATLIDHGWTDFLQRFGFRVGVSIDGPQECNDARVNRAGMPAFHKIMRGIHQLRRAGIPFMAICVVTADTIGRTAELLEFFSRLGCDTVGFNIEEMEGLNAGRVRVTPDQARLFWRDLWQLRARYPGLRIRDLDRLRRFLSFSRGALSLDYTDTLYDPIPTVATTGETVVLSPELLGIDAPGYNHFVIGNVLSKSLPALLSSLEEVRYVAEFERALRSCAARCEFWDFCQGAQAGNRFFEHGTFDITETAHCRNSYQSVVRSALDHIYG